MEFYTNNDPFPFDEDTTDTEDDSGIAEISSSVDDYANEAAESTPGTQTLQSHQPQDALGRFFSYW